MKEDLHSTSCLLWCQKFIVDHDVLLLLCSWWLTLQIWRLTPWLSSNIFFSSCHWSHSFGLSQSRSSEWQEPGPGETRGLAAYGTPEASAANRKLWGPNSAEDPTSTGSRGLSQFVSQNQWIRGIPILPSISIMCCLESRWGDLPTLDEFVECWERAVGTTTKWLPWKAGLIIKWLPWKARLITKWLP